MTYLLVLGGVATSRSSALSVDPANLEEEEQQEEEEEEEEEQQQQQQQHPIQGLYTFIKKSFTTWEKSSHRKVPLSWYNFLGAVSRRGGR